MQPTRLRTRLLLAFSALFLILAAVVYGLNVWSFNRGFSSYLQQQSLTRLRPLARALADYYARHGTWEGFVADPRLLGRLARQSSEDARPGSLHGPHEPSFDLPPPPGITLLDAQRRMLVGPTGTRDIEATLPVTVGDAAVGYLGMAPAPGFTEVVDSAFAHQQRSSFALTASVMVCISVIAAILMGRWLGRPIGEVARALHALARGQCEVRVAVTRGDELGQLAQDVNRLAVALDASRQARQAWFMDIAHELRTPLTVLRGEIEAVEQGVRRADVRSMQSLREEVYRLALLVDDLHLLSQADAGALRCSPREVDLAALIDEHVARFGEALSTQGISLQLTLESAPVWGDPERLRQLLSNLMQNTLRYTVGPGALHIAVTRVGQCVHVVWEDSAPGVRDVDLPRLGERFFQPTRMEGRVHAGSGIGLSIVRVIAEAHDMSLVASSSELGGLRWELRASLQGDPS
ncbi:ATP-binding protein [Uliginosibacterium sp. sgz301328]|uniref:ATP-binding protein n=1 Tax=Uliginosibacterium sp. sgz301328 TaxID=3243764 RepID=UPI00359E7817